MSDRPFCVDEDGGAMPHQELGDAVMPLTSIEGNLGAVSVSCEGAGILVLEEHKHRLCGGIVR